MEDIGDLLSIPSILRVAYIGLRGVGRGAAGIGVLAVRYDLALGRDISDCHECIKV